MPAGSACSLAEDAFVYQPIYESASDEEINTYLAGQEAEDLRSLYLRSGKEVPGYLQQGNTAQFRESVEEVAKLNVAGGAYKTFQDCAVGESATKLGFDPKNLSQEQFNAALNATTTNGDLLSQITEGAQSTYLGVSQGEGGLFGSFVDAEQINAKYGNSTNGDPN